MTYNNISNEPEYHIDLYTVSQVWTVRLGIERSKSTAGIV